MLTFPNVNVSPIRLCRCLRCCSIKGDRKELCIHGDISDRPLSSIFERAHVCLLHANDSGKGLTVTIPCFTPGAGPFGSWTNGSALTSPEAAGGKPLSAATVSLRAGGKPLSVGTSYVWKEGRETTVRRCYALKGGRYTNARRHYADKSGWEATVCRYYDWKDGRKTTPRRYHAWKDGWETTVRRYYALKLSLIHI